MIVRSWFQVVTLVTTSASSMVGRALFHWATQVQKEVWCERESASVEVQKLARQFVAKNRVQAKREWLALMRIQVTDDPCTLP